MSVERFAEETGPRLRHALVAAYGLDAGHEAAAEAMAYAVEHWPALRLMSNPGGYLFRVGQTAARRARRTAPLLPAPGAGELPDVEPGLTPALNSLSEQQRVVVVLVVGLQWRLVEVAELLNVSHSTVRVHLDRALGQLRQALEGASDGQR